MCTSLCHSLQRAARSLGNARQRRSGGEGKLEPGSTRSAAPRGRVGQERENATHTKRSFAAPDTINLLHNRRLATDKRTGTWERRRRKAHRVCMHNNTQFQSLATLCMRELGSCKKHAAGNFSENGLSNACSAEARDFLGMHTHALPQTQSP